ncbi:hypothetical protein MHU86_23477 [Fragilaria crotonensis]|nr:hypothetical protein MHU86_23477 [Fragilaria crotonensis]
MRDFPDTVRKAVGAVVPLPCAQPFIGMKLLQPIRHDQVARHGLFRRKPVLTDFETNARTRADFVVDLPVGVKEKLESLGANSGAQYVRALQVTQSAPFLKARLHVVNPPQANDLAGIGLKAASDDNWSLCLYSGLITKKSLPTLGMRSILQNADIKSDDHLTNIKGVVTAIYSVTGALTYVGDVEHVTTGEAPIESAHVLKGWHYTATDDGNVILSEIGPKEWIIAIEYKTLEELMMR